ncbi:MAG: error-prone DNA polymerase [Anaerolineae bacterium]|nr:error-prone DNA polymerase [Anaerolineae bacterium]
MYVELHAHSYYSLLDGASSVEDLVKRAAELAMPALALTDHDNVYGAVRFWQAAQHYGIRPIFGAELTFSDDSHLTLIVRNDQGWRNLCNLISLARFNAPKGDARLPVEALDGRTDGLIALSGCRKGAVPRAIRSSNWTAALDQAKYFRDIFGKEHFFIELQCHHLPDDDQLTYKLAQLAEHLQLRTVATNNVHYAERERHTLQDVLVCIRHGATLDHSAHWRRVNSEYYLKSAKEMAQLFADMPEAIHASADIAARCTFEPTFGLQELPRYPLPDGLTAGTYLRLLCMEALSLRIPDPPEAAANQLGYELTVIERAGLANYFLVVWDIVKYANDNGIRCQGRGSAANSLVSFLLGISPIDPVTHALVFERFLSEERPTAPDIDIDFDAARREEVIQYIYERYGHDHAAMAATFVTFQTRSARRDVGKVLGFPPELIESNARNADHHNRGESSATPLPTFTGDPVRWQLFEMLTRQLHGFPRHLGIHNGGFILTRQPIAHRVATEPATMPGRIVVQWDKDSIEDAGLVKVDVLGLRMLSAISAAVNIVAESTGAAPNLSDLSPTDPAVYAMLTAADTVGVFQTESRAQMQTLPKLRPEKLEDVVVSISLIRPGPVQGNMVHPYLRRRSGREAVVYPHQILEPALSETLGVILFQEQVLKVARDMGQFTPGQGELLRRTLGKGTPEQITEFERLFIDGAAAQGITAETAGHVFQQLRAFGGYSFPKSHAAAFAVLVYQSAWLKHYHPLAFYVGLLNNQPMGFWSPAVVVNDARRHSIKVLPISINRSMADCTVEGECIRLGLGYVSGLKEEQIQRILEAREGHPFTGLADLIQRCTLPRPMMENLILIGALDEFERDRRSLLWRLGEAHQREGELPLAYQMHDLAVKLPELTRAEKLQAEYLLLGLSPGDHPMSLYQDYMRERELLGSRDLAGMQDRMQVKVMGQVVMHQSPPTAKGHHFITLEDEAGMINIVVRPAVYEQFHQIIRGAPILIVGGEVQRSDDIVNMIAHRFETI